ncbi:hypothetical protein X777_08239, partial [Ooceraea biroi]
STCAVQRILVAVRVRPRAVECMWVSVLRAKVKPVAGVAEVGRIRVTDQRAPRERPAPGNPRRRSRRDHPPFSFAGHPSPIQCVPRRSSVLRAFYHIPLCPFF